MPLPKFLAGYATVILKAVENRIRGLVTIDDIQFGFIPGKGMTHALFILEKAFDRGPRKVMEWALRKDWQKCWCKQ